jgi:hypothetical protein
MNCPNLKELFGDRYRIIVEESHAADRAAARTEGSGEVWAAVETAQANSFLRGERR